MKFTGGLLSDSAQHLGNHATLQCHAVSDGCEIQAQLEPVDVAHRNKWQFFFKHM
jgi:hypothetical protein